MTATASYAIRRSDGQWYVGTADKKPRFAPSPTRPLEVAVKYNAGVNGPFHLVEVKTKTA